MVMWKFNEYLQEILAIPAAVFESPSFPYTSQLANDIFPAVRNVLKILHMYLPFCYSILHLFFRILE